MKNLLLLCLVLSFAACNPYNKLDTRPPVSAKDSLLLANRCDQAFPTVPEYIEGKTIHDTIFVDPPSEIDLGEAETILVVQGYNVDSLKRAILKECKPKQIRMIRVDTFKIVDNTALFIERKKKEEALAFAAKTATEKELYAKQVAKKYEKFSMYKFAFYLWPIWLLLTVVLYIMARNNWSFPIFKAVKKMI